LGGYHESVLEFLQDKQKTIVESKLEELEIVFKSILNKIFSYKMLSDEIRKYKKTVEFREFVKKQMNIGLEKPESNSILKMVKVMMKELLINDYLKENLPSNFDNYFF